MTGQNPALRLAALPILVLYGVHYLVNGPGVEPDPVELPPPVKMEKAPEPKPVLSKPVKARATSASCADTALLGQELGELIREATVSSQSAEHHLPPESAAAMKRAHAALERMFPAVHRASRREVVADFSLLYRFPGLDMTLKPVLLLCHLDVSPVEPGTEASWTHPPFSGHVDDTFVWGRGAIDMKNTCAMMMHALESLLTRATPLTLQRAVYLAIGHDEEVGGGMGAKSLVALLSERGVVPELVLDEGSGLVEGGVYPLIHRSVAFVSTAEKGYMSVQLTTNASGGGHSSRPKLQGTPITVLSEALGRLQSNQFPVSIQPPMTDFLDAWADQLMTMQPMRAFAKVWRWWKPLVEYVMGRDPQLNFFVRTTTAVTMINAGVKENVIPGTASAIINHRLMPTTTNTSVLQHYERTIDNPEISINPTNAMPNGWMPASKVAPVDTQGYRAIVGSIKAVFGKDMPVLPFLLMAGADARHYVELAEGRVYRFSPTWLGPNEMSLMHGTDERIPLESLGNMCHFFSAFLESMCA